MHLCVVVQLTLRSFYSQHPTLGSIVQCKGEADFDLAVYGQDERSFVVSGDSDFYVVRFLPTLSCQLLSADHSCDVTGVGRKVHSFWITRSKWCITPDGRHAFIQHLEERARDF